jgi:hypothetical protein
LVADDGATFMAGELLRKTHNAFVSVLRSRDTRYFEGFALRAAGGTGQPPLYRILLGVEPFALEAEAR